MNRDLYSNSDFTELRKRLNQEISRRGTYKWFDPLTTPQVGEDRSSPLSLPDIGARVPVDDKTYTVNTPSEGSIERTKNIMYPAHGVNPSGEDTQHVTAVPNTSAGKLDADELRNFLVGLAKIKDINLFYGRDEIPGMAFRDPQGIEDVLNQASKDKLNMIRPFSFRFYLDNEGNLIVECLEDGPTPDVKIDENGYLVFSYTDGDKTEVIATLKFKIVDDHLIIEDVTNMMLIKDDPNGGVLDHQNPDYPVKDHVIVYPEEDGVYVMRSGEFDGEETLTHEGLGPNNFFDDYGARPGDGDYHPFNRATTPLVRRDWVEQDDTRREKRVIVVQGGVRTSTYGQNPRNPNKGSEYISRPVYTGVPSTCNVACTGLCSQTCDSQCSESCASTCWGRCGNACTSTCGNVCTGCSTMCYTSCKTKCENISGYACLKAGAKAIKITTTGGRDGVPARNEVSIQTYACQGCSYSCQFYPNKKTTCWDSGCMGNCFTSCETACSTSCVGGCIDNNAEGSSEYKTGKGRGCSGGCTVNCVGSCSGVCEGQCVNTCWHACKQTCSDNCTWKCSTNCGHACSNGCKDGCTGCAGTCTDTCMGSATGIGCTGCGTKGGCTSTCQHDCNKNCVGFGCRSICGIDAAGACEANCRINCMQSSCTALCSDACSSQCTTCVNTCGWQCGACTSECSNSCGGACEITCTATCEQSCELNCVRSCSEECGGCSDLCYSCVGMCIGVCSVKCESGCSNCTNTCGWWCDTTCNQQCFGNCDDLCIQTCSGSCATFLESKATLDGPERDPTAEGYPIPHPKNREEERESFRLIKEDQYGEDQ